MVLMHRTEFEIAVDDMDAALNGVSAKLHKLMHGDLRKRAGVVDLKAELDDILADVGKLQKIALANCSVPEIAAITGHSLKTVQEILDAHYLGGRVELAESAIKKLNAAYGS